MRGLVLSQVPSVAEMSITHLAGVSFFGMVSSLMFPKRGGLFVVFWAFFALEHICL